MSAVVGELVIGEVSGVAGGKRIVEEGSVKLLDVDEDVLG